jgi:2,3,4,5-tetrahydropyridine-2,6-dicarboxylate N-succinyltransferase
VTTEETIAALDRGELRVAEPVGDEWVVHPEVQAAILDFFRARTMEPREVGPFEYHDKIPLKSGYEELGVRVVPPAVARYGAFLSRGVVLMPSYVNIGAWVGPNTMVDTWATVGSCAQIGSNVHLSGGVGIGGVLEPPNARPVIIEDNCIIGSRSMITQGARVCRGSVLGEGTVLNPGIPVIDAESGEELSRGVVPPYSIAVQAQRPRVFAGGEFFLPCVLVLRRLGEGERHDRARLNDVLREHGLSV